MTEEIHKEIPAAVQRDSAENTVMVVGGGVAGISAACALADAGFRVMLLERRGYLGGRAASYFHPGYPRRFDPQRPTCDKD